jgi:hypothetical protein
MSRSSFFSFTTTVRPAGVFALVSVALFSVAACSGGEVAVGKTEQQLQTRKNGTPTGNGQTCSWDDTVAYDVATGKETTTPAANGPYSVGQSFKSLDGCNDCSCTAKGIMCTVKACGGGSSPGNPGQACTDDAMVCPDGSSVGRTGPNCEFAPCPGATACDLMAKICPDGSAVGKTGPNCEWAPCPGEPSVDPSKLGQSCTNSPHTCPTGQSCSSFPTYGFRCSSDPCAALTCPAGTQCLILESFPSQIKCGN